MKDLFYEDRITEAHACIDKVLLYLQGQRLFDSENKSAVLTMDSPKVQQFF